MAITFDAASTSQTNSTGTFSFSHTTAAGAIMLVGSPSNVTGITYNGVSLSLLDSYTPIFPSGTNCPAIKVWILSNPASGTNTVEVTTVDGASVGVVTLLGAREVQSSAVMSHEDSANNQVVTWDPSVTTDHGNCWPISFLSFSNNFPRTLDADTGSTTRVNNLGTINGRPMSVIDNNAVQVAAGTATIQTIFSGSSGFVTSITIGILPAMEISVSDSITIIDSVNVEILYDISVSDSITITESVNLERTLDIIVNDSITITESVTIENPSLGDISVSENISISENLFAAYYPAPITGYEEMPLLDDDFAMGMDDDTIL